MFAKFVSLNEGDQYMDPKRRALLADAEKSKAFVTDKPFKMVSPAKRSVGLGDYYGTLGSKLPHEPVRWNNLVPFAWTVDLYPFALFASRNSLSSQKRRERFLRNRRAFIQALERRELLVSTSSRSQNDKVIR